MPLQQRIVVIGAALLLMAVIFELVRKRRLREEYSWLWLLGGLGIVGAALIPFEGLMFLAHQMGSSNPPAAISFLGFMALLFLCLQFSVRLSKMTDQVKNLGQKIALLEAALEEANAQPPANIDGGAE